MASEIRVNSINNRSGLGTVTIADSGLVVSGIVTASTFSGNVNITSGISTVVTLNATTSIGINTSSPKSALDLSQATTGIALPQGTTAQRPTGNNPYIRWNTTNSALEFYNGTDWVEIISDYFPSGSTNFRLR
jgi:hypothetical protein